MIELESGTQRVKERVDNTDNGKTNLTKITCPYEENKNEMEKNLEVIFDVRMRQVKMKGRKKKRGKLDYLIRDQNT